MKKIDSFSRYSLLFAFLILFSIKLNAQNSELTPLGYYDNLYLGMSLSEFKNLYNVDIEEADTYFNYNDWYNIHAKEIGIEVNVAELDLAALGKTFTLHNLDYTHVKLFFINSLLVEIYFWADDHFVKEEQSVEIYEALKTRFKSEYKGIIESRVDTKEEKYWGSFKLSSKELADGKIADGGNLILIRFRVQNKRNDIITTPEDNYIKITDKDEIEYWSALAQKQEEVEENGLKSISSFRDIKMGISLDYFKEKYSDDMVPFKLEDADFVTPDFIEESQNYLSIYTLRSDKLSLMGYDLKGIYYFFFEDKLDAIFLPFDESVTADKFNEMKSSLKVVYGDQYYLEQIDNENPEKSDIWYKEKELKMAFRFSTAMDKYRLFVYFKESFFADLLRRYDSDRNQKIINDF